MGDAIDEEIRKMQTVEDLRRVAGRLVQRARVEYWDLVQAALHEAQEQAVRLEPAIGEVSAPQAFAAWCDAVAARLATHVVAPPGEQPE